MLWSRSSSMLATSHPVVSVALTTRPSQPSTEGASPRWLRPESSMPYSVRSSCASSSQPTRKSAAMAFVGREEEEGRRSFSRSRSLYYTANWEEVRNSKFSDGRRWNGRDSFRLGKKEGNACVDARLCREGGGLELRFKRAETKFILTGEEAPAAASGREAAQERRDAALDACAEGPPRPSTSPSRLHRPHHLDATTPACSVFSSVRPKFASLPLVAASELVEPAGPSTSAAPSPTPPVRRPRRHPLRSHRRLLRARYRRHHTRPAWCRQQPGRLR